jgi:GntP family gluconate:H+ symporter
VDPLWIVLLGTAVMVVCLMMFRLPAFLALVLGGLTVAVLTPNETRQWQVLRREAVEVMHWNPGTGELEFARTSKQPNEGWVRTFYRTNESIQASERALLSGPLKREQHEWQLTRFDLEKLNSKGFWLVSETIWAESVKAAAQHPLEVVAEGFGATCRSIGLLIVLAAIIGQCLTDSGAAERIVRWIQDRLGESRAPQGFALSGFLLGIPVFFDTVFYLLMPLGRGLSAKTGRNFLLYTLSIVAGATMAHSLVPPTPGPLFAANAFGVPLGMMMLGGLVVGGLPVVAGLAYAHWANRRWPQPLRAIAGAAPIVTPADSAGRGLPALGWSLLPIVLPLLLIAGRETLGALAPDGSVPRGVPVGLARAVRFLGESQMALLLGTVAAVLLLTWRNRWLWAALKTALAPAVESGGVILLITAAGGAFGAALRQTDVASRLSQFSGDSGYALLVAAFGITALVRIAQGSATVAMITAAGVIAPLMAGASLPYHPLYLALAVGCGSKPIPWFNDSGFWIISRMSGMTETETLRSASVMMSLMGVVGFVLVLLGAWLLPLG